MRLPARLGAILHQVNRGHMARSGLDCWTYPHMTRPPDIPRRVPTRPQNRPPRQLGSQPTSQEQVILAGWVRSCIILTNRPERENKS